MDTITVKEIVEYLKPGNGWKIGAIVCVVFSLVYAVVLPILTVVCLLIAALCVWRFVNARKKMTELIESNATSGPEITILNDFNSSNTVFEGKLKLGAKYLFGKGSGKIVLYSDITQLYQRVERTYFIETGRSLQYKNAEGKVRPLCQLPLRDKAAEEVLSVMAFVHLKNPNVKLGYK